MPVDFVVGLTGRRSPTSHKYYVFDHLVFASTEHLTPSLWF